MVDAHENHERFRYSCLRPIDAVDVVTGYEGNNGSMLAVSQRDPGVRRDSKWRRDARNHFERNPCFHKRFHFLPAATEDERIAALQAHDGLAFARLGDHQVDNLGL